MMNVIRQACLLFITALMGMGQDEMDFRFEAPLVLDSVFDDSLGMIRQERDEYASNLVIYASNEVLREKASPGSLALAKRVIALALHLSRGNKQGLHLQRRLKEGKLPAFQEPEYGALTLSGLIFERARKLENQPGDQNRLLARYLMDLAATLDSKNEEIVEACEMQKIEYGRVPWSKLTGNQSSK